MKKKIPLWDRNERMVGWIGFVGQRKFHKNGEGGHDQEYAEHDHGIHVNLTGIEGFAALLGPVFVMGPGRPYPSKNKHVEHDAEDNGRW